MRSRVQLSLFLVHAIAAARSFDGIPDYCMPVLYGPSACVVCLTNCMPRSILNTHSAFAAAPPAMAGNFYLYSLVKPALIREKSWSSSFPNRDDRRR